MNGRTAYLLVNFGGPRDLEEIEEFLIELLTDQEVIRSRLPGFLHTLLFTRIAKKRTHQIAPDYALIGGKSPIFEDTESVAASVGEKLCQKRIAGSGEILTFHRYLPRTHKPFIEKMESLHDVATIRVVPMFPQFSYATTGSIALWMSKNFSAATVKKLQWIRSYPTRPSFISAMVRCLREFLEEKHLEPVETMLLFSAHGLPQSYVTAGDVYENECRSSFDLLESRFPKALSHLSYQSQFGKEEWIRPYTSEVCSRIRDYAEERKNVVVIPLSFTSDHFETLYEIEHLYMKEIRANGLNAFRCPALNCRTDWIDTVAEMFEEEGGVPNSALIR